MPALRLQPRTPTTAAKASFVFHLFMLQNYQHALDQMVSQTHLHVFRQTHLSDLQAFHPHLRSQGRPTWTNTKTTRGQCRHNTITKIAARASLIDSKAILWKATGTTDPDLPSKPGKLKLAKMGKWNSFSPRDHKRSPATSTAAEEPPSIKKSKYP